jgi:hypothetical protein
MARIGKLWHEDQGCYVGQVLADAIRADSVISSGAEGAVENSLDLTCLVAHQHRGRSKLGSVD